MKGLPLGPSGTAELNRFELNRFEEYGSRRRRMSTSTGHGAVTVPSGGGREAVGGIGRASGGRRGPSGGVGRIGGVACVAGIRGRRETSSAAVGQASGGRRAVVEVRRARSGAIPSPSRRDRQSRPRFGTTSAVEVVPNLGLDGVGGTRGRVAWGLGACLVWAAPGGVWHGRGLGTVWRGPGRQGAPGTVSPSAWSPFRRVRWILSGSASRGRSRRRHRRRSAPRSSPPAGHRRSGPCRRDGGSAR